MTSVTLIIITYNSEKYILPCLKSVFQNSSFQKAELIILDNNSEDRTITQLKKFREHKYRLIALKEDIGYTKAANLAATKAKGKFLFFLNPDTTLSKNFLLPQIETLSEQKLYTFLIKDADDKIYNHVHPVPNPKNIIFKALKRTDLIKEWWFEGTALLMSKKSFEKSGGFNESYFQFGEDLDFCYRAYKQRIELELLMTGTICHFSGNVTSKEKKRIIYRNYLRFFEDHYSGTCAKFMRVFFRFKKKWA